MRFFPADMPAVPVKKSDAGFTFVEIAVALGLAFSVIDLTFLAFNIVNKYWRDWQDQERTVRIMHLMNSYVTHDLLQCEWIQSVSDSQMVLYRHNNTIVRYQWQKGLFTRNGMSFNMDSKSIVAICLKPLFGEQEFISAYAHLSTQQANTGYTNQILGISFFAELTDGRNKKYIIDTPVYLRNPGIGRNIP